MRMKLLGLLLSFPVLLLLHANGAAQNARQSEDSAQTAQPSKVERLDTLLEELRRETDNRAGERLAKRITALWTRSGSETVDLLMEWAAQSIARKDYALASDLLDQVTVLKPGFAEGWNRRATLYYFRSDYSRSLSDIEKVLNIEPRHFGALSGLAAILYKTGKKREALNTWYRVLDIYPASQAAQKGVIELEEELSGQGI